MIASVSMALTPTGLETRAGQASHGAAPAGSGALPPWGAPAGLGVAREAAARGLGASLEGGSGRAPPATTPPPQAPPAAGDGARAARPAGTGARAGPPDTGAAAAALAALGRIDGARARLDAVLAEARRGRSFSAAELLCLQADAHRFAQTVELVARAAEHGVQGVKQAVHLQV